MSRKLYFECSSGISGDMSVAALLDLGADEAAVLRAIDSMGFDDVKIEIKRVSKNGIDACDFNVICKDSAYDHDMEYLHGHEHEHHHGHEHHHEHHGILEITDIINRADMTGKAKKLAIRIFDIIAAAEAKAHNTTRENVHFHEVGAVDSIIDIAAFAVCMDSIGIDEVIIPRLVDGKGFIRCQHGVIPVPVPAVLNIAEAEGLNLQISDTEGELVTPTGAAVAAAVKTGERLPDGFKIIKSGLGAGKRNYDVPSLLRVMIIEEDNGGGVFKLETNIDDCTGEILGYTAEMLLKEGALDVYYTPIYMKKNRPAYLLSVICSDTDIEKLEKIIFQNTTTIGIRRFRAERTTLEREAVELSTSLGNIQAKKCEIYGRTRVYPEYESVKELCQKTGMPYIDAFRIIFSECNAE